MFCSSNYVSYCFQIVLQQNPPCILRLNSSWLDQQPAESVGLTAIPPNYNVLLTKEKKKDHSILPFIKPEQMTFHSVVARSIRRGEEGKSERLQCDCGADRTQRPPFTRQRRWEFRQIIEASDGESGRVPSEASRFNLPWQTVGVNHKRLWLILLAVLQKILGWQRSFNIFFPLPPISTNHGLLCWGRPKHMTARLCLLSLIFSAWHGTGPDEDVMGFS